MHTYTQLYYHIIFGTKKPKCVILEETEKELFKYIWGIIQNKNSNLIRINANKDHVHLLVELHQSISIADFVKDIKVASSGWIKENNIFPFFVGWQVGYGAFTVSHNVVPIIKEYIINQKEHHKNISFVDEWKEILEQHGIGYDEKFLFD